jgi:uncharacterized protein YbjT (DUF2867 family)
VAGETESGYRDAGEDRGREATMIAVMGASGNVGSKVADLLLDQNEAVRVFARSGEKLQRFGDRGAEVLVGDAMNAEDLRPLFRGADAAVVLLPDNVADERYVANRSTMARAIVGTLRDEPVGHVVMLSSIGANRDSGVGPIAGLHELEQLLFGLDEVNVLALRAAWHMENLLANLPLIQSQGINGGAVKGDHRFPMMATVDIARAAAERLVRRDFTGHVVATILGPEDITMNEATSALGTALGKPDLPYVEFPPEGLKAALLQAGMSEEFASLLLESQDATNEDRVLDGIERTAETSTPTGLGEFLKAALSG